MVVVSIHWFTTHLWTLTSFGISFKLFDLCQYQRQKVHVWDDSIQVPFTGEIFANMPLSCYLYFLMRCDGLVRGSCFLRSRQSASLSRARYSSSFPRTGFYSQLLPSSEEQPSPLERCLGQTLPRSDTLPCLGTEKEEIAQPLVSSLSNALKALCLQTELVTLTCIQMHLRKETSQLHRGKQQEEVTTL